jgi:hypothetical protein
MRLLFVLAGAGVLFFVVHNWEGSFSPASSIREMSKRLDKATKPHPQGRWVDQLNGICRQREQQLAKLAGPSVLDGQGLAAHSARVLAIHRAYAKRVARVRAPKPYAADLRHIRALPSTPSSSRSCSGSPWPLGRAGWAVPRRRRSIFETWRAAPTQSSFGSASTGAPCARRACHSRPR